MFNLIKTLALFFITNSLLASGSESAHHSPSISDLLWPTFNIVVLISFMIWKLKAPVINFFKEKSEEVKDLFDYAEEKNKEADIKLEMYESKIKSLSNDITQIKEKADIDLKNFAKSTEQDTQKQLRKIELDSEDKLESEQNSAVKKMSNELLNSIVLKTKTKITRDKSLQDKAATKIMSNI